MAKRKQAERPVKSVATYSVKTWDMDLQEFTPQNGVPAQVHGMGELRRALRSLQGMGYDGTKADNAVLVEREPTKGGG